MQKLEFDEEKKIATNEKKNYHNYSTSDFKHEPVVE